MLTVTIEGATMNNQTVNHTHQGNLHQHGTGAQRGAARHRRHAAWKSHQPETGNHTRGTNSNHN